MKTTRSAVFETNSSSTHAISIADAPTYNQRVPTDINDVVHVSFGCFGWEWAKYTAAVDKLSYVATYARQEQHCTSNDTFIRMFEKVVCDHLGAKRIAYIQIDNDSCPNGYVDTDRSDITDMFASERKLRTLLFSSDSYIRTGNDNECPPPDLHEFESLRGYMMDVSYHKERLTRAKEKTLPHIEDEEVATMAQRLRNEEIEDLTKRVAENEECIRRKGYDPSITGNSFPLPWTEPKPRTAEDLLVYADWLLERSPNPHHKRLAERLIEANGTVPELDLNDQDNSDFYFKDDPCK